MRALGGNQDGARGRPVRADDLERQADEQIRPRLDGQKVEPLNGGDVRAEQEPVGLRVPGREVVEPDQAHAAAEEVGGPVAGKPDEIAREGVGLPELRVPRLEEPALGAVGNVETPEGVIVQRPLDVRGVDHVGGPDERLQRELVRA